MDRDEAAAFAWAEQVTGATVVSKRLQARWRPHWFLELETPAGETKRVMLRGFRNPGYLGDESITRRGCGASRA